VEDLLSISIEDLEDVGFFKLGHQKRLLLGMRRIKELRRGQPTQLVQAQVKKRPAPVYQSAVFLIQTLLIRILLFTLIPIRIRILLFNLIRIRI
jgi:hypothetical protein